VQGHPAAGREAREGLASQPASSTSADRIAKCITRGYGSRNDTDTETFAIASPLAGHHPRNDLDNDTYVFGAQNSSTQGDSVSQTTCPTLDKSKIPGVLSVALRGRDGGATAELGGDMAGTLRASGGGGDKAHAMAHGLVRRLTPVECERLQGFPDNYTAIPGAADGPRYAALGNSMAVPVMAWIGKCIDAVRPT
jgi:site-specific DNA-cytosine methylase